MRKSGNIIIRLVGRCQGKDIKCCALCCAEVLEGTLLPVVAQRLAAMEDQQQSRDASAAHRQQQQTRLRGTTASTQSTGQRGAATSATAARDRGTTFGTSRRGLSELGSVSGNYTGGARACPPPRKPVLSQPPAAAAASRQLPSAARRSAGAAPGGKQQRRSPSKAPAQQPLEILRTRWADEDTRQWLILYVQSSVLVAFLKMMHMRILRILLCFDGL